DNIRMENIFEPTCENGAGQGRLNQLTAVKCDLCSGQSGGPACKRACPHDAIDRIDLSNIEVFSSRLQVAR
ncbi:MAG: hypothetical protein ACR2OM_01365, partial [Aestuariivirgaceae bacterium]